ncbi:MAG: hypothetical protein ACI89X_000800 [Planctomycetota bacterium]|jgi:hypothetical protein
MVAGDKKHSFLVAERAGSPIIAWFRAGGAEPAAEANFWNASLVLPQIRGGSLILRASA